MRVNRLKDLGVGVPLCGALSRPLEGLLATTGIVVIAWLCGSVEEIMRAYLAGFFLMFASLCPVAYP